MKDKLEIGEKLLHYIVTEKLGEGGMGEVYKGVDKKLNRTVAIKVLRLPEGIQYEEGVKRFLSEARVLAKLSHATFPTIYEIEDQADLKFIVMEFLDGKTLKEVGAEGKVTFKEYIDIFKSIAEGMSYLHQNEILHRDLKPSNIMISNKGIIKILDFGLAKWEGDKDAVKTQANQFLGSLHYSAPEIFLLEKPTERTEVYALGVSFINTIMGFPIIDGSTVDEIVSAIKYEEPVFPKLILKNIPKPVITLVENAIEKDSRDRTQSMKDFAKELDHLMDTLSSDFLKTPISETLSFSFKLMNEGLKKSPKRNGILYTMTLLTNKLELKTKAKKRSELKRPSSNKNVAGLNEKVKTSPKRSSFIPILASLSLTMLCIVVYKKRKEKLNNKRTYEVTEVKDTNAIPHKNKDLIKLTEAILKSENTLLMGQVEKSNKLINQVEQYDLDISYIKTTAFKKTLSHLENGDKERAVKSLFYINKVITSKIEKAKKESQNVRVPASRNDK